MERKKKIKILQKLLKVNPGYFKEADPDPFMPARVIEEVRKNMEQEEAEIKKKVNKVKGCIRHLEEEIWRDFL